MDELTLLRWAEPGGAVQVLGRTRDPGLLAEVRRHLAEQIESGRRGSAPGRPSASRRPPLTPIVGCAPSEDS